MFLFVYGTLRKGFPGEMAQKLASESEWIGHAMLENAQLYRIHWDNFDFDYPALVQVDKNASDQPCRNFVIGDLVRLKYAEQSIKWLDDYEECGEQFNQPNEYMRKEVTVKLLTAQSPPIDRHHQQQSTECFVATTYVFAWPTKDSDGHFVAPVREHVAGGDWLTFMEIGAENGKDNALLIRPRLRPAHPSQSLLAP